MNRDYNNGFVSLDKRGVDYIRFCKSYNKILHWKCFKEFSDNSLIIALCDGN